MQHDGAPPFKTPLGPLDQSQRVISKYHIILGHKISWQNQWFKKKTTKFGMTPKIHVNRKNRWTSPKLKPCMPQGHHREGEKTIHKMGENTCTSYLIRAWCPEHTNNFHNSTIQKTAESSNRQRIWRDISLKKIRRWPVSTGKDHQHCLPSGKCKSKPRWDTTSHLLGCL